ncbi:MAG: hypothetical protein ACREJC_11350 [Tepidisphaeraceae bacterium]
MQDRHVRFEQDARKQGGEMRSAEPVMRWIKDDPAPSSDARRAAHAARGRRFSPIGIA